MILVTILGDFYSSFLPINYEFRKRIKKHIILYDNNKYQKKHFQKVLEGQEKFLKKSSYKYQIQEYALDGDSYEHIINAFKRIINQHKNEEIYLNATDGFNSVSILFAKEFLENNLKVLIYDRFENSYNLHYQKSISKEPIKDNLDIKTHFLLKGYEVLEYEGRNTLLKRKEAIVELMQDSLEYKHFVTALQKKETKSLQRFKRFKNILESIGKYNDLAFIQGKVFEEYIYHLIVDNCDFDDVMTGVRVRFDENFENEFDILMIKENHLHTIECKFVNFLNGEHFVYKTNSIIDYLDDDGRAMILSIGGDNIKTTKRGKKRYQFTKGDKGRAQNGNIKIFQSKIFNKEQFLNEVREWFL